MLQLNITGGFGVGMVAQGKIAAIDVGAAKCVAMPVFRVEVGGEEFFLDLCGEFAEGNRGRLGESPAKSL